LPPGGIGAPPVEFVTPYERVATAMSRSALASLQRTFASALSVAVRTTAICALRQLRVELSRSCPTSVARS
jgi:hypothetical protein